MPFIWHLTEKVGSLGLPLWGPSQPLILNGNWQMPNRGIIYNLVPFLEGNKVLINQESPASRSIKEAQSLVLYLFAVQL